MPDIKIDMDELTNRFMRYVQIDTQSDPNSQAHPTTEKQKVLSRLLYDELIEMGLSDVFTDEFGYVYASIPSNSTKANIPSIAFCSHIDTAPDCSGFQVKPILHKNYNGNDIVLPDDPHQVLSPVSSPYLSTHIGSDIITASGLTLLGADDKSGVAVIMQAAACLIRNPEWKHGAIKIVFTPDEEVGMGTAKIDLQRLNAQYGYTLDGGEAGDLEDETFNADAAVVEFEGIITHPGTAKNKLVNALKVAGALLDALPKDEWSPETTELKEGFVHPVSVNGIAEKATVQFIVRDFSLEGLHQHHIRLRALAEQVVKLFPGATMNYVIEEQYRNMKEVLDTCPHVVEYAEEAIVRAGLTVRKESIRGGTDGSRLSHMGLPCPNIFTGMQNIHSKLEWIGTRDMAKAVETVLHLCMIWEEKQPEL